MISRSIVRPSNASRALRQTLSAASRVSPRSSLLAYAPSLRPNQPSLRPFHAAPIRWKRQQVPEQPLPTNFSDLDVLGGVPPPSTSVDVCMYDGFGLNSGMTISDGDGALLVDGEVFLWRPWEAKGKMELLNKKGQVELPAEAFSVFDLLWPRPDMIIIGVGKTNAPLSPETRRHISELGMRVEVLDTRNAAAQFNLLATERGVGDVAAALIPIGWKEGVGAK